MRASRTLTITLVTDLEVLADVGSNLWRPLFLVFPWSHLIFTEPELVRWRARFRHDAARSFDEVDGVH